jgi:enoyl-CoA hydratase/carnithine racemase
MIELIKEDGLWIVTINRPEKANSLTEAMLTELAEIAESAQEARALILTGTGKVFSAGADLEEARAGLALSPVWERLSSALAALPCLKIAALNGTLAGGANGMVLACDLRSCVPSAMFFYPVM